MPDQEEIDIRNLEFYASLFREHKWETREMGWNVFSHTLNEIAARLRAKQKQQFVAPEEKG